ncbi:MAG: sulfatase [Planctomycetota bacterium]
MPSKHARFISQLRLAFFILGLLFACPSFVPAQELSQTRPNVLFIAVDDLRPELNCYGAEHIHSPNIDRLAGQGILFENAYCMVPTCGASRASLMTGLRPSPRRFTNYLARADKDAPEAVPLHKLFLDAGYQTISLGKVFHHSNDHADGWSEPPWDSEKEQYQLSEQYLADVAEHKQQFPKKKRHRGMPFESADVPEEHYPDADCAARAVRYLEQFAKTKETKDAKAANKEKEQNFFLAVGFLKPHLPFNAPKKYWDLYDPTKISLPDNYYPPKDAPKIALHNSGELRSYAGIHPSAPVDAATGQSLIHGYYACVSFIDAQVGLLLDALEDTGLAENTVIVLWGDHGWQLGEHGMWNKHSCFETSMHTPMIVVTPASRRPASPGKSGARAAGIVEFIDIYPTLCELTGIRIPAHVQGESFMRLLQNPASAGKQFAVGRFKTGETIRDAQFRYSEYPQGKGERPQLAGQMVYDHRVDPGENFNQMGKLPEEVARLSRKLHELQGK